MTFYFTVTNFLGPTIVILRFQGTSSFKKKSVYFFDIGSFYTEGVPVCQSLSNNVILKWLATGLKYKSGGGQLLKNSRST